MIRFVIRAAFWSFLALAALPSIVGGQPETGTGSAAATSMATMEATFHAARFAGGIASDLGSLCERNGAVCESGRALAEVAAERARQGLVIAAGAIDRISVDDATTGSTTSYPIPAARP